MTADKTKTSIKTKTPPKLVAFDAARYLDDDEAVAEYMTAIWKPMILICSFLP